MTAITGKIIAGVIGYITLGPVGLLFGIAIGHAFDRGFVASPSGGKSR